MLLFTVSFSHCVLLHDSGDIDRKIEEDLEDIYFKVKQEATKVPMQNMEARRLPINMKTETGSTEGQMHKHKKTKSRKE